MNENPQQVVAFQEIISTSVEDFLAISSELGEPVIGMAKLVKEAFDKSKELIRYGLYNKAPPDAGTFFTQHPLAAAISAIQTFREKNRQNTQFWNHLSAVSESILALSWITVPKTPAPFILEMKNAGQYYGNRVLQNYKGNAIHQNWINKWNEILTDVEKYVKNYFLTGYTWGSQAGSGPSIAPPPPPPAPAPSPIRHAEGDGGRQALLAQLNQGTAITSMLKSAKLRGDEPAAVRSSAQPAASACRAGGKIYQGISSKPPKFELEGRKWIVANQLNTQGLKVDNNSMSESLNVQNCENSSLEVLNKINSVSIDTCKKAVVLLRDVIGSVEVIRCDRLKIQCEGKVPLINIDNSESVQIFVNEASRNVEIITSKSSSCNVCLMLDDGDYIELPIPEQIRSVLEGEQLKSTVVETRG